MPDEAAPRPPRAILSSFPREYSLPGKPAIAGPQALDAYRQTGFLLGEELALFERTMNEVLTLISANAKARGPRTAAMITLGARAFSHLADACTLMSQGSYASCPPLVRMALEAIAVQQALSSDEFGPYQEWYQHAISHEGAAVRIELGRSKAASVLVADENLGHLYRLLMDLSMPHFGSALLFAAPETSLQKIPLSFADNSFHLGFAQLISGWLLQLAVMQLSSWLAWSTFVAEPSTAAQYAPHSPARDIAKALGKAGRCYVERVDDGWVFHNFRRTPSGQPKRIVLGP
ncbi:MAG TPA: hypothetical protein VMT90_00895 [Dehalococcoidia bacterium]|nr:hypothetical protein [Dehalococcoidia bacterium]